MENVPIVFERIMHAIHYDSDSVKVTGGDQAFEGDMALCTLSLGALKNGSIKFIPKFPQ